LSLPQHSRLLALVRGYELCAAGGHAPSSIRCPHRWRRLNAIDRL